MWRRTCSAALLAALIAAGCGGEDDQEPRAPRPASDGPSLCSRLHSRVVGRVQTAAATELSGLALSGSTLWTHNDSGGPPRLLALGLDGRVLDEVDVAGADNFDWEDVAAFDDHLYVGDIGDNAAQRSEIVVYRVPARSRAGAVTAERIPLRYSDRAQDAEALLVDPTNGALVVVTKRLDGTARVYAAEGGVLRGAGVVKLGNALQVTAGSVSGDGRTVVLRTYDRLLVWTRRRGESLPELFRRRPCTGRADLLREGQGESVALTRDGRAVYTVPEGLRPPLRRWAPTR